MSYGFEVKNPSGSLIVDASYQRFGVDEKITAGPISAGSNIINYTNPSDVIPLIEFGLNAGINYIPIGANFGKWSLFTWNGTAWVANTTFTAAQIAKTKLFNAIAAPTGYGVAVYNDAGQITYSSAAPIVSFREAINGLFLSSGAAQNITISSDVTHVFYQCGVYRANAIPTPPSSIIVAPVIRRTNATTVNVAQGNVSTGAQGQAGGPFDTRFQLLTAKITW